MKSVSAFITKKLKLKVNEQKSAVSQPDRVLVMASRLNPGHGEKEKQGEVKVGEKMLGTRLFVVFVTYDEHGGYYDHLGGHPKAAI